jgi:phosphodiesterase/alkaline phosphatase D-like protein
MGARRDGGSRPAALLLILLVALLGLAPAARQEAVGFSLGVACGEMAADSVVLWTRPDRPTTLFAEIDDRPDFTTARRVGPFETRPADDLTVHAVVDGLAAGTRYHYRFQAADGARSETGTCRTAYAPNVAAPLAFAFSGDTDWIWRPFPLLRALNRESLDFFVFLGDLIYEWTDDAADFAARPVAETLDEYRAIYRRTRTSRAEDPSLAFLRDTYARFGQYSVFDNHETGLSRADPSAPRYSQGGAPAGDGMHAFVNQTPGFVDRIRAYADYQPIRARQVEDTGDPRLDGTGRYYYAQQWGRDAVLIVADDRSYRDAELASADDPAADSPDRTILGRPQLAWLEETLRAAQARGTTWKLVVISSPIQELGRAAEVGVDLDLPKTWAGGYRAERNRLLRFIAEEGIDNVVFLTTDYHFTQVNNLRYQARHGDPTSSRLPAGNAWEIIAGPLGAFPVLPPVGAPLEGRTGRAADHVIVDTFNGDVPSTIPAFRGLRPAGLDPVGLEPDFPGLVVERLFSADGPPGVWEPAAFASYNSFTYAVLSIDGPLLTVRVVGEPATGEAALRTPAGLADYLAAEPRLLFGFQVRAR